MRACVRTEVLSQERSSPQMFQPMPFHYVEISKALFTHKPVETFGGNQKFSKVRHAVRGAMVQIIMAVRPLCVQPP